MHLYLKKFAYLAGFLCLNIGQLSCSTTRVHVKVRHSCPCLQIIAELTCLNSLSTLCIITFTSMNTPATTKNEKGRERWGMCLCVCVCVLGGVVGGGLY